MKIVLALMVFLTFSIHAEAAVRVACQTPDQQIKAEYILYSDNSIKVYITNDALNIKEEFESKIKLVQVLRTILEVTYLDEKSQFLVKHDDIEGTFAMYRLHGIDILMECDYGIKPGTMGH